MATLRINHTPGTVEATFECAGAPRESVSRSFSFALSPQDVEDFRWYLEDYLVYPLDPAPKIAAAIEKRMRGAGVELFNAVLAGSRLWAHASDRLEDTRIEIESDVGDALIPWELLRDPEADLALALHVPAFVRRHSQAAMRPKPQQSESGKIRILLAICRPGGAFDVPFRSVARYLMKGLSESAREHFDLEVLRPPTFEQLNKRLRAAKSKGEPFHVVHFDGHGSSGAVWFENPALEKNAEPVKAELLGRLLRETGVPILILNACRSAFAEPPQAPKPVGDVHEHIRQFGSLAHAVMDYGASGVVAWRYNVFVSTAAKFMAELYGALASGVALGEAATMARKQLSSSGQPIEDWTVPIVFEAAPVRLFPKSETTFEIKLNESTHAESGLPQPPDVGFIGRDETVLQLDRIFDQQPVALLHAYAGSGKTSTAVEFARWYQQTGGIDGPILFTSFERKITLPTVLDQLGKVFELALEKNGIQWLTKDNDERRSIALQVMKQVPVLWIWDNVEPIAGFPAGTSSAWTTEEQKELLDFLSATRTTKAKFLLTSRRDEHDWLHNLPARLELPPMVFEDRVQMTRELAGKSGRRLEDVEDWRPLLEFTQGNPLTITVLVGQALRDGLRSRAQIANFVRRLGAGEASFEDEASEGRTRSLAASLAYGFENAFTEAERKQLALLHLFQGFVDVDALRMMGDPDEEWHLPEVEGLTREAGIALLDRAVEIGLLTSLREGFYVIHPALPWFFRQLFEQYYAGRRTAAEHAFVEAIGYWGNYHHDQYGGGNRAVIGILAREEANLLQARGLARAKGWWDPVASAMQGLRQLYRYTGRRADWARLVEEIVPDFVDPNSGGPFPGREDDWSVVMEYRVRLAEEARQWEEAERLQRRTTEWNRSRSASVLARPVDTWSPAEKNQVRTLGASLHGLAEIQRERGSSECVKSYQEALALAEAIGDSAGAVVCAFNLGNAFKNVPSIRDLDEAEGWHSRGLDLRAAGDRMGRARSLGQLGSVACERFRSAREAGRPDGECLQHLNAAAGLYHQALEMLPQDAPGDLATVHNSLGLIYDHAGRMDAALEHYRQSIRYWEIMGDHFGAGRTRYNVAGTLAQKGRFSEARDWVLAALHDFEASDNADEMVLLAAKLLLAIESDLQATSPPQ